MCWQAQVFQLWRTNLRQRLYLYISDTYYYHFCCQCWRNWHRSLESKPRLRTLISLTILIIHYLLQVPFTMILFWAEYPPDQNHWSLDSDTLFSLYWSCPIFLSLRCGWEGSGLGRGGLYHCWMTPRRPARACRGHLVGREFIFLRLLFFLSGQPQPGKINHFSNGCIDLNNLPLETDHKPFMIQIKDTFYLIRNPQTPLNNVSQSVTH